MATQTKDDMLGCSFVLLLVALAVYGYLQWRANTPTPTAFEQRDAIVVECMASERYTRDECLMLAGEG